MDFRLSQLMLFVIHLFSLLSKSFASPMLSSQCAARSRADPPMRSTSCIFALKNLLHRYPRSSYSFDTINSRSEETIKVPLRHSYSDCSIILGLFYTPRARETMSHVVAAADRLIEDCVGTRQFSGGSRNVGNSGLWVEVLPASEVGNPQVLINSSIVDWRLQ